MSDDLEKNLWDSTAPKVKLIGGFAKHCIDHEKQRAELRKFVETMVEGLKQQEDEEEDIESRYKFRVRKFSLLPRQKSRTTDKEIEFTVSNLFFVNNIHRTGDACFFVRFPSRLVSCIGQRGLICMDRQVVLCLRSVFMLLVTL
jgi:hypothetical protein